MKSRLISVCAVLVGLSITVALAIVPMRVETAIASSLPLARSTDARLHSIAPTIQSATVIATVPVGLSPRDLAVNPITNRVYVANSGADNVSVIDGVSNTVYATITVGSHPYDVSVNPNTNRIYVPNNGSNSLSVIDGASNTVITTIPGLANTPQGVDVHTGRNLIYTNYGAIYLAVVNGSTNVISKVINTGGSNALVAVDSSLDRVYVSRASPNVLTVIDSSTNAVITTVGLPGHPAVNPITNRVYLADFSAPFLRAMDGTTDGLIGIAVLDYTAARAAVNPNTNCVYVTEPTGNRIAIVNGSSMVVLGTVTVGNTPDGVAVSPATGLVYVANRGDNTVSVIQDTNVCTPSYTISGHVTDTSSSPITWGYAHAQSADGGDTLAYWNNSSGIYTITVPAGTYTVTLQRAGYSFTPASIPVVVPPNATGNDFVGTPVCYSLTPLPATGGIIAVNTPQNCAGGYTYGTVVMMTATKNSGFKFTGWGGDATGMSFIANVVMNGSKSVNANFAPISSLQKPVVVLVHGWHGLFQGTLAFLAGKPDICTFSTQAFHVASVNDINGIPPELRDFGAFPYNLIQDGRDVWIAHVATGRDGTPIIEASAECLKHQLEDIRNQTGVNQITLIAHSMGGLVSRAYLENPVRGFYAGDVERLITLGTPHVGTSLGNVPCSNYKSEFAACQFSTIGISYFNQSYSQRAFNVHYDLIGGNLMPGLWGAIVWASEGPNDGVVGAFSSVGARYEAVLLPARIVITGSNVTRTYVWASHINLPDPAWWPSYFNNSYLDQTSPTVTYKCVRKLLGMSSGVCPPPLASLAKTEASTTGGASVVASLSGHIVTGQTVTRVLSIDTGDHSQFGFAWITGTVGFTLTNPIGTIIDPAYVAAHPTEVAYYGNAIDTTSQLFATYQFTTTVPGVYILTITAQDVGVSGTDYSTSALVNSPRALTVTTDSDLYAIGRTATLTASIQNGGAGLSGATVIAQMSRPGVITDSMTLIDRGNGIYTGTYTIPIVSGYLGLTVIAQGNDAGTAYARQADSLLAISSPYVQLNGHYADNPQDADGNGKYESLNLNIGITSTQAGNYLLSGDLVAAGNVKVAHGVISATVGIGTVTTTLPFNGDDIRRSGLNGPYTLTNLAIVDQQSAGVPAVWLAQNVWTTSAYTTTNFAASCFVLTTSSTAGGSAVANPAPNCNSGLQYASGTIVTLTATTNPGFNFVGWSGDAIGQSNPFSITIDADKSVTANFATPPISLSITGSTMGRINRAYTFTATVSPISTTIPITYVWQATGQQPVTHTVYSISDTLAYNWNVPGIQSVTVTAANGWNIVTGTQSFISYDALYVAPDGNCGSASPCYADIQSAVDAALTGDTIKLAQGTYTVFPPIPQVVYVLKAITLTGGYTITNWVNNYPITQTTLLNGEKGVYVDGANTGSIIIQGLTMSGGIGVYIAHGNVDLTDNDILGSSGSGVYIANGTVALNRNTIHNSAPNGVYAATGTITLSHNTIVGNGSNPGHPVPEVNLGSGITVTLSDNVLQGESSASIGVLIAGYTSTHVTLNNNTILSNTWGGLNMVLGGGFGHGSSLVLNNNTFIGNSSEGSGLNGTCQYGSSVTLNNNLFNQNNDGAVFLTGGGNFVLSGNTFISNTSGIGSGVYLGNGDFLLAHNYFQNNSGNAIYIPAITPSGIITLSGNVLLGNGVGIAIAGGAITAQNDIIANSTSQSNGAVYLSGGKLTATNWTLANNSNYALINDGGSVALTNTIVASQTAGGLVGVNVAADHTLFFNNGTPCVGGAICNHSITGDPKFINPAAMDYHIGPDSAAIDQGIDADVYVDIDSEPRPMRNGFDIGADELPSLSVAGFSSSTPNWVGQNTVFTNTSVVTGSTSYAWDFGDGTFSTAISPTHVYTVPGNYTVILTATNNAGHSVATSTAAIYGASFDASNPIWLGQTAAFTNTTVTSGTTTYQWAFGDGALSISANPTHTYSLPATYTVILTATNSVGAGVITGIVTVFSAPDAAFTTDSPRWLGQTSVFTNATTTTPPSDPTVNYLWSFGDGGNSASISPTHNYAGPGIYTTALTATNAAGSNVLTSTVTVYSAPSVMLVTSGSTWLGQSSAFTATVTTIPSDDSSVSLTWNFGDGTIQPGWPTMSHTYTSRGSYSVILTATNAAGQNVVTGTMAVYGPPIASFATSSPNWLGQATQFTNTTTGQGPITYLWDFGDGFTSTLTNPDHHYGAGGLYTITLTANNPAGDHIVSHSGIVYSAPLVGFTALPVEGIRPLTVVLTNTTTTTPSGDPTLTYSWSFGDGQASMLAHPTHSYPLAGAYTVTLMASNAGGSNILTQTNFITVSSIPVRARFIVTSTSGVSPLTIVFTNISTGDYSSSLWDFGDDNASTQTNPTHTYQSAGTFSVTLSVTRPGGTDVMMKPSFIIVASEYKVYLPLIKK